MTWSAVVQLYKNFFFHQFVIQLAKQTKVVYLMVFLYHELQDASSCSLILKVLPGCEHTPTYTCCKLSSSLLLLVDWPLGRLIYNFVVFVWGTVPIEASWPSVATIYNRTLRAHGKPLPSSIILVVGKMSDIFALQTSTQNCDRERIKNSSVKGNSFFSKSEMPCFIFYWKL